MNSRILVVGGVAAAVLAVGGAVVASAAGDDEPVTAAEETVADLPTVSDWRIGAERDGCRFDEDRGGLVVEDLTVSSRSTGVLELVFHVERDSADDILPGQVSTLLVFDEDTRSRTFDLVLPVTRQAYEAGYDECRWSTRGG